MTEIPKGELVKLSYELQGVIADVKHGNGFDAVCLETIERVAAALLRNPGQAGEWISVEERMPKPGVLVLAHFVTSLGKGRTVRAHHAPKHTIEASHWDEDVETDDTEDGSFEPEGWYEDPSCGETLYFISPVSDGVVTHWMPLPAAPRAAQAELDAASDAARLGVTEEKTR